jgi:hypothetical protein
MSFQTLLAELDELNVLAKSDPVDAGGDKDDKTIAAAADEGAGDKVAGEGDADAGAAGEGAEGGEGEGEGDESLGKSFQFELANGEKVDAIDGTELIKSLTAQVGALTGRLDESESTLLTVLTTATDLIKSQGAAINDLNTKVAELGNSGRGRKAIVAVIAKPEADLAKAEEPQGLTRNEFMLKAEAAFERGAIRGLDISMIETSFNKGLPVPENIRNRVLA